VEHIAELLRDQIDLDVPIWTDDQELKGGE